MVVVADHEDMIKRLRSQNSTHHIQLGKMDLRQKMSGWSHFEIPNLRHDVKLNVNIFFPSSHTTIEMDKTYLMVHTSSHCPSTVSYFFQLVKNIWYT